MHTYMMSNMAGTINITNGLDQCTKFRFQSSGSINLLFSFTSMTKVDKNIE